MTFDDVTKAGSSESGRVVTADIRPVVATARVRPELVEAVWNRHYAQVYRYALALTRSHDDAQEIVSEVFERALARWVTVPEPPLPWLLVVTRRIVTDRWRRARRLAAILFSRRRRASIEGAERRSEFWAWYDAVSAVLTDRQREVLALRYRRELTDEQIGEVMGLSRSGVRSLVGRALDALRAHPEVL
jgi:RNA polymerase sigma-70 factor, ECF subfamily